MLDCLKEFPVRKIAYKVVTSQMTTLYHDLPYGVGGWYTSVRIRLRSRNHIPYDSGFHCWVDKMDALYVKSANEEVWEVEIDGIVATGFERGHQVVVAKKMRFIRNVIVGREDIDEHCPVKGKKRYGRTSYADRLGRRDSGTDGPRHHVGRIHGLDEVAKHRGRS